MIKLLLLLLFLIPLICYYLFTVEQFENSNTYINVYPYKHSNKYLLYENNQNMAETNNLKNRWDYSKHYLESIIKTPFNKNKSKLVSSKIKDNKYKVNDLYLKQYDDNQYDITTDENFLSLKHTVSYNNDYMTIYNQFNKPLAHIKYGNDIIEDSVNGKKYLVDIIGNIEKLDIYSIFKTINEINRDRTNPKYD